MSVISLQRNIDYPESDGRPMGETDLHRDEILDLIAALEDRYREMADVYVAGNIFLYYQQGNPRAVVCPDIFLVRGVPKQKRRTYKLWQEGHAPSFVIEVTSLSSQSEDLDSKKSRYAQLGVAEYFLHDPYSEYLVPPLRGFRLLSGRYWEMTPATDGSLRSEVTGLTLRPEGQRLRLLDTDTGEPLLWITEVQEKVRQEKAARAEAEARAAREAKARQEAESALRRSQELARLRHELEQRKKPGL